MKINSLSKYLFILFYFILFYFVPGGTSAENSKIESSTHLNMIIPRGNGSPIRHEAESIYKEAFNRLGIIMSTNGCVPARCGTYVSNGTADGEMVRTITYEKVYPELIRAKEPVLSLKFSAFSKDPSIRINSWNDLIGKKYKIAYIPAYYFIENNIRPRVASQDIIYVNHWKEGLNKLSSKDADIYIGVERTVLNELKEKETSIRHVAVLSTQKLYPYFNKKHEVLAKKLSSTIREMKAEGLMKESLSNQ